MRGKHSVRSFLAHDTNSDFASHARPGARTWLWHLRPTLLLVLCLLIGLPVCADVVYVSDDVETSGAGSSWSVAKKTIAEGFNAASAGDEVWIRSGEYVESVTIPAGVYVFGGFAGTETQREERDPALNPVLVHASAGSMYTVTISASDVLLDSCEVSGGSVASVRCSGGATGIVIQNCVVRGAPADGIRCDQTSPAIIGCFIHSNGSDGIYSFSASPGITACYIVGNDAHGINCSGGAPAITECTLVGNGQTGLYLASGTGVDLANTLVVGHGASGIVVSGSSTLTASSCGLASNTPSGYGTGGAILLSSGFMSLRNSWLFDNPRRAIRESTSGVHTVAHCLFQSNPEGDYFDYENWATYSGATAINTNINGASGNIDGDPLFEPGYIGAWTGDPVENTTANTFTLTDANANYTPGELVGTIINCDTSQRRHAVVVANTATTIEVAGYGVASYALAADTYMTKDYHVVETSPCNDIGTDTDAPNFDLDGYPRPVDVPSQGTDGTGIEYDIGPYEYQIDTGDKELRVMGVDGGGTVVPGDGTYPYNSSVTLTATPKRGCDFDHWHIRQNVDPPATPEEFTTSTNPYHLTMTKDWDVWAYFSGTPQYVLTADTVGPGQVSPAQGTYDENTEVVVTATPDAESEFVRWEGDANGSTNPLTVVMDEDKNITAVFSAAYELTTSVMGSGGVTPSGGTYLVGTEVQVLAVPDQGWVFWHWQGVASGSTNPTTVLMDQPKSLTAVFSLILPNLSVSVTEPNESVSASLGDSLQVSWTVQNDGFDAASGSWTDTVHLSRDATCDAADRLITSVIRSASIPVGSDYTESIAYAIPDVAPGVYYLIVRTDVDNSVAEVDETTGQTSIRAVTVLDSVLTGTR
jgi:hypothetical protein